MDESTIGSIMIILFLLPIFFLPTIIALVRKHHYKWVIFAINLLGMTGVGYIVAFVWAVWPRQTAIFDVVTNDPTTNSSSAGKKIYGQMGANVRAFREARDSTSYRNSFCKQCGNAINSNSRFCQQCGASVN